MRPRILAAAAAAALLLVPLAAGAQKAQSQSNSYRCVSKDGKKFYGSTIPRQCIGQPVEELDRYSNVVRRIDPEGTEKERAAKEAAEAKQREELAAQREAARRNRALLAAYTSTQDIDEARKRALAGNAKSMQEVESRIAAIRKRQSGYQKELELYKGKGEAPQRLAEDLQSTENDLKYHEQLLEAKKKEAVVINARFDDEKKRFTELTGPR